MERSRNFWTWYSLNNKSQLNTIKSCQLLIKIKTLFLWHYLWWCMHFQYLTGLKGVGVGWERFVHTGHNLCTASDIPPDIWHNLENKPNQTCLLTELIHCIRFIEALYSIFSYKEFCIHFQYSCSCKSYNLFTICASPPPHPMQNFYLFAIYGFPTMQNNYLFANYQ